MNLLVIDAEFNQPSGKLIQVGAVAISINGVLLGSLETKVDPEEPISPEIITLTRITDQMTKSAPSASQAYAMLWDFKVKHKCFMNPVVWGSGTRNDSSAIYEQSGSIEPNFMGHRVLDAKTLYQTNRIFTGGTVHGGLQKALKTLGLGWDHSFGDPHDALADALNTARIYVHLGSISSGGRKVGN